MINYVQKPVIKIFQDSNGMSTYDEIVKKIKGVTLIETYPGVRIKEIVEGLKEKGYKGRVVYTSDFSSYTAVDFRAAILPDLTEDRVFGKLSADNYSNYFDKNKISAFVNETRVDEEVLVIGICAYLFKTSSLKEATLIYADLPRWEIQLRYRAKEGVFFKGSLESETLRNFKRGYFVEWRMADRIKQSIWNQIDLFLDTTIANNPRLVEMKYVHAALKEAAARPFRLVPYFDAGVWGGHWMKDNLGLGDNPQSKWAWGFDGVPEENSLIFEFEKGFKIEMPAINIVLFEPQPLLGTHVYEKFGAEFPIRFDFLDTIGGQNLSLQVHPTNEYIRKHFKMSYTQEESYYILDVDKKEKPACYLGVKDGITKDELFIALEEAQQTNKFDAEKYVNKFPAKKHDHFHHPAGCIHSSASGCMVLEISATPYIFTFKLWDWARVDFDGKPRPINLAHGKEVIRMDFNTTKCLAECVSPTKNISSEEGYVKEHTGLHEEQYIETIRHNIDANKEVVINCENSVNMLNLVEGDVVTIAAIKNEFPPLEIHFAETFIVPASCNQFKVIANKPIKLLQAFVRK